MHSPDTSSPTNPPTRESPSLELALRIGAATLSRLCLNTARRFPYPFAPALSRGLGVPLPAITSLIAVNQATGFLGALFGPVADRFGYRIMMLAGLGLLVTGMFAGGLFPYYGSVLTALFFAGLGKSLFDPALQAYMGEKVPFERRGLIIGVLETSWAGSTLLGVPLVGLLMEKWGWRSPFIVLGILGLFGMISLFFLMPREGRTRKSGRPTRMFAGAWGHLFHERPALGVMGFALLVSAANDNLFVVYGVWFENNFGLSILALGLGTAMIGAAELLGEALTATIADRIGLKRSVVAGLLLSGLSYFLLPLLGNTMGLAMGGLFFVFLTLEFSIVTCLSLCTEVLPAYRATMMSGYFAAAGIGRVLGALLGGPVWLVWNIQGISIISTGLTALALFSLLWGLKGWRRV